MSRVDVVVPCYNYGKFLADCVTGALDDQPGTDVRVLIIDDASQVTARRSRKSSRRLTTGSTSLFIPSTGATSPRSTKACSTGPTETTAY